MYITMCETKYLNKLQHFSKYLTNTFLVQYNLRSFSPAQKCFSVKFDFVTLLVG